LLPRTKWILALDRTEWERGDTTVNLLVLAVVTQGCAVPLLWTVMPACGASDTAERKELLARFVVRFGKERARFLTADREFIGFDWMGGCKESRSRSAFGSRPANICCTRMDRSKKRGSGLLSARAVASRSRWICGACPSMSGESISTIRSI